MTPHNPQFDGDDGKPINKELLNFQLKGINDRLASIDRKLDASDLKYPSNEDHTNLKDRVKRLEDNQSKVVWIILTAVILAVLGTIIITRP